MEDNKTPQDPAISQSPAFEPSKEIHPELPAGAPTDPPRGKWQSLVSGLKSKVLQAKTSQTWNQEGIKRTLQSLEPQVLLDWASKTFQKRGTSFYGTMATIVLSTYFMSDLTALLVGEYLPEPPVSRMGRYGQSSRMRTINDLGPIFSRNLFSSRGVIPGEDANTGAIGSQDPGGPPVKSSLPLNLIGTLIMSNELRSIATIEDKAASMVYPVRVDDEIPDKVRVIKIEPRRVIFINKSTNRKEYIELPEDAFSQAPRFNIAKPGGGGVEKVSPTQFNVSRTEVDKALADFNNILTQARAVPNFENGAAAGYKLFQIVPGSIYDKLGLQNGDVISGLNGQPINDPGKAFEMLSELKTANHLELQVKKDGKLSTYSYDIR